MSGKPFYHTPEFWRAVGSLASLVGILIGAQHAANGGHQPGVDVADVTGGLGVGGALWMVIHQLRS